MSQNQKPSKKPKPISIAFDSNLGRLFVLHDDGKVLVLMRYTSLGDFDAEYVWKKSEEIELP